MLLLNCWALMKTVRIFHPQFNLLERNTNLGQRCLEFSSSCTVSHSMTLLILVPISTYLHICYFCNPSKLMCVCYLRSQLTDFDQLFKNEVAMLKANSSSDPQNHPLMRQFREAVWV